MSLHAQIFEPTFSESEITSLFNISTVLKYQMEKISNYDEILWQLQEIDVLTIPDSLKMILNIKENCNSFVRSYTLCEAILKLSLLMKLLTDEKVAYHCKTALAILDQKYRLESIYKESLNRFLSM